jgi:IPT/TIG domain-containing protein
MRATVSRILLLVCALSAVVPATAGAATAPKVTSVTTAPKVTSVTPLKLKIGDRLTIKGKGFLPGKNRNTVVFKASGARAVFAKAQSATKTKLVVKVPAKLAPFLKVIGGQPAPTRFQLRVLARKLSPSYTPAGASPTIAPAVVSAATTPVAKTPAATAAAAAPAATAAPADAPPVLSAYEPGNPLN